MPDYRPVLRALQNVQLELENAKFEVAQTQGGRYEGELIRMLERARTDVQSVFWQFNQALTNRSPV